MSHSNNQSSSWRKQKALAADLSLFEKLDTILAILTVLGSTVLALFSRTWKPKGSIPTSYYRHGALTALRTFTRRTSVRQQHYLSLPTDDAYAAACNARGVIPNSEILEDGTKAHWIGNPKAEKLILNFHGGGYVLPAPPAQFEFVFQIIEVLKSKGKNAACLFLSYDLAPGALYPRQLQQAAALLLHVLNNLKYSPDNIILMGDSAGGNLLLALLSHISHPHPSTSLSIPRISLTTPFRSAVLNSPWISFDLHTDSFKRNEYKDCITTEVGKKWSGAWLACPWPHKLASDYYNQAITAPLEWWDGLMVKEVLVLAGEEEVLVDGIKDFAQRLSKGFGEDKVELVVSQGGYHDQPYLDLQIGYKEKHEGQQAKEIKQWIGSKL